MSSVEFRHMTKRFEDVVAVNDLNLDIKDKEFVSFLGPSGCGKTTSLRCLAGLERPSEGEIYIGDTLVNELEPKERNVAMVFQNYALYPHMTVYKNMAFPLENFKLPANEVHQRIVRAAKLLQIVPLLGRKPAELSGGQQQRVALGRAIVRDPQVFLMDEPLSNLDAKLRVYMRAELKRLQDDLGVTTIYVTHDQVEAMTMADRIAILEKGVLQQYDSPNAVYKNPANAFVAGFIGSPPINFFDATIQDGTVLDTGEFQYELPADFEEFLARASSDEIIMAVRPQDITVHREKTEERMVRGTHFATEPLGDMTIIDLRIGDDRVKVVVSPDFEAEQDEELWMRFSPDRVHIFDKKTEKALV